MLKKTMIEKLETLLSKSLSNISPFLKSRAYQMKTFRKSWGKNLASDINGGKNKIHIDILII